MKTQTPELYEATFNFVQPAHYLSDSPQKIERLEVKALSGLGIDQDNGCYFTIKTDEWAFDSAEELEQIFKRIKKVINKDNG